MLEPLGAHPDFDAADIPTDLILLTGGGISNCRKPVEPAENVHDFPGDWDGMFGRIHDAAVLRDSDCNDKP